MSEKSKTTISIKTTVYEAAQAIAEAEVRDFSFIVERALIGELRSAGIVLTEAASPKAEVIAAAEQIGFEKAANILVRHARKKKAA